MKIYFGYGSNLDFDDWSNWCSRRNANPNGLVELQRALLPGYSTNLVDYIGLLDRIEGTNLNPPLYRRKLVPIDCNDGKLRYGICYFYNGSLNGAVMLDNGVWH